MEIQTLIFDLGKVLIDFDFERGVERFARYCPLPPDRLKELVLDEVWVQRYERGEISTSDYCRRLCEAGYFEMEVAEFHESWSAIFLPDPILPEALLARLKQRYPMILLSNTNASHAAFIANNYSVFNYFDHKIFSHEVGSMKPDRAIYEAAVAAANRPPENIFFTDDREENVAAARRLGIRAHRFTSAPALLEALTAHGINCL